MPFGSAYIFLKGKKMKMSIDNYLSYEEELVPNWIMNHEKGDKVDLDDIFTRDRVVFILVQV